MLLISSILALIATPTPPLSIPVSAQPSTFIPATSAPLPKEASAFDFSYTFVELGYYSTNVDSLDETSDAIRGRASLGLFNHFFGFLDYAQESVGTSGGDVDNDSYGLGVGAHFGVTSSIDLVGEVSWLYDDLNSDTIENIDDSESGWSALAGARWMVLPTGNGGLEVNGGYRWIERETLVVSNDQTGAWEAGARFHFLSAFSVGADVQLLDDDRRWGLNARFSF
jgi:hypothetical protein